MEKVWARATPARIAAARALENIVDVITGLLVEKSRKDVRVGYVDIY